jgi:hypothetical protein
MQYLLPTGDHIAYPALVAALAKPGQDILDSLTAQKVEAWHHASCIPGEAGELFDPINRHLNFGAPFDRQNVIEELGDIEFYMEGLRAAVGLSGIVNVVLRSGTSYMALPARAAEVFDATKKWVLYNKPLNVEAIDSALTALDLILDGVRASHGITREEVLAYNVMKLGIRYATLGYSDAQAQARADKTVH